MVMAHSLVQVLLSSSPGVEIHMLAPPASEPLALRMPGVADSHVQDIRHGELALGRRRRLGRALRAQSFDRAIVLPNSFKSALVPWWARIPRRIGWTGEGRFGVLNDRRTLDKSHLPMMIERFMALGLEGGQMLDKPYPRPQLRSDAENSARLVTEYGLDCSGGVSVLCPGAEFGPAKRWPTAHFVAVARHFLAQGRQVWLIGSAADASDCASIEAEFAAGVVNLAGKTRLVDAVDLLALADCVVSNDSGLMHIACALQRSVVAIFGSTSAQFTPPLGEHATVVRQEIECSPCFQRECPLGHLRCLRELQPERVIEVL
jgi:heptosyltransferase-2